MKHKNITKIVKNGYFCPSFCYVARLLNFITYLDTVLEKIENI